MKIVIVGGGTAGWIASYFIYHSQPNVHDITVIESSKIGVIGVGEGSTGTMIGLLDGFYLNQKHDINEFLKEVDGSWKMGIYHNNWKGDGTGYFAPIDGSETDSWYEDALFKYGVAGGGSENMHQISPHGWAFHNKDFSGEPNAVHFDGWKVGQFFKKHTPGINLIDSVVNDIIIGDDGDIKQVKTEDGHIVEGDLFIDCTGFARILMKKIGVKWESYSDFLPLNAALPFHMKYDEGESWKDEPYTRADALSSGWMWTIPLQSRKGMGYVFDSRFINYEEAQKEVEEYLGKKIEPIRQIKFDPGRGEYLWKNNVLSLGLASTFVEPLEATSIHTTITQLVYFCKEYLRGDYESTMKDFNRDSYNDKMYKLYDSTAQFISFHYCNHAPNTPFWKSVKPHKRALQFKEKSKHKISSYLEFCDSVEGAPHPALWNWIAAGLGIITPQLAEDELLASGLLKYCEQYFENRL